MECQPKKVLQSTCLTVLLFYVGVVLIFSTASLNVKRDHFNKDTSLSSDNRYTNLSSDNKILCLILTSPSSKTKLAAVEKTWTKRCDEHIFVLAGKSVTTYEEPFLYVKTLEDRGHLTDKVMLAYEYVYNHLLHDFDWILKSDDDTYVIVENLRHLLSQYNSKQLSYVGYHMRKLVRNGYMSGGAGYVISRATLQKLGNQCFKSKPCMRENKNEDVAIGLLLQKLNVSVLSSLDHRGRETFHPETLEWHANGPFPHWLERYGWNKPKYGEECCSDYSISFHHLSATQIYLYEHLLYRMRVYGKTNAKDGGLIFAPKVLDPETLFLEKSKLVERDRLKG